MINENVLYIMDNYLFIFKYWLTKNVYARMHEHDTQYRYQVTTQGWKSGKNRWDKDQTMTKDTDWVK